MAMMRILTLAPPLKVVTTLMPPLKFMTTLVATALSIKLLVGVAFARHACRSVFNREPPLSLSALWSLLRVTRPLELAWRAVTFPWRTLPDVHILGECRCGTTSLASLLRDRLGMLGPFTPWVHPLADEKESFYFVGHYFGVVTPALYRLCFPWRVAIWARSALCGRARRLLFDGCASHLSAPWAAPLLQQATPSAVLIVCVREPVSQHVSWWRLERGAMAWGDAMGLGSTYVTPPARCGGYPPPSLADAVALSRSPDVAAMWRAADELCADAHRPLLTLPGWAIPFPNGQLSAFDRMGRYADNLERWRRHFGWEHFVVVSLDEIERDPDAVLERIAAACERVLGVRPADSASSAAGGARDGGGVGAADGREQPRRDVREKKAPRLNASTALDAQLEPDADLLRELGAYYRPHNERLFEMLGRDLGWHDDPRYWWYRPVELEGG